jgi:hypothetical protein
MIDHLSSFYYLLLSPIARILNIVWFRYSFKPASPKFNELTDMQVIMCDPAREHLSRAYRAVL